MSDNDSVNTVIRSNELTCPSCVAKIERALGSLPGVKAARVHFSTGRIEVRHETSVSGEQLAGVVRSLGYAARVSAY